MHRYGRQFAKLRQRFPEGFPGEGFSARSENCDDDFGDISSPPFPPDTGSTPASDCRELSIPPSERQCREDTFGDSPDKAPRREQILAIRDPSTGLIYSARHVYAQIGERSPPDRDEGPSRPSIPMGRAVPARDGSPGRRFPSSAQRNPSPCPHDNRVCVPVRYPSPMRGVDPRACMSANVIPYSSSFVPPAVPLDREGPPTRCHSYVPPANNYSYAAPHAPPQAMPAASSAVSTPMNDPNFLRRSLTPLPQREDAQSQGHTQPATSPALPSAPAPIPMHSRCFGMPMQDPWRWAGSNGVPLSQTDCVPMRGRCSSPMPTRAASPMGRCASPFSHSLSQVDCRSVSPMGMRSAGGSVTTSTGLQPTGIAGWSSVPPSAPPFNFGTREFSTPLDMHPQSDDHRPCSPMQMPAMGSSIGAIAAAARPWAFQQTSGTGPAAWQHSSANSLAPAFSPCNSPQQSPSMPPPAPSVSWSSCAHPADYRAPGGTFGPAHSACMLPSPAGSTVTVPPAFSDTSATVPPYGMLPATSANLRDTCSNLLDAPDVQLGPVEQRGMPLGLPPKRIGNGRQGAAYPESFDYSRCRG